MDRKNNYFESCVCFIMKSEKWFALKSQQSLAFWGGNIPKCLDLKNAFISNPCFNKVKN